MTGRGSTRRRGTASEESEATMDQLSDSSTDDEGSGVSRRMPKKRAGTNKKGSHAEDGVNQLLIAKGLDKGDLSEMPLEEKLQILNTLKASEADFEKEEQVRNLHEAQKIKLEESRQKGKRATGTGDTVKNIPKDSDSCVAENSRGRKGRNGRINEESNEEVDVVEIKEDDLPVHCGPTEDRQVTSRSRGRQRGRGRRKRQEPAREAGQSEVQLKGSGRDCGKKRGRGGANRKSDRGKVEGNIQQFFLKEDQGVNEVDSGGETHEDIGVCEPEHVKDIPWRVKQKPAQDEFLMSSQEDVFRTVQVEAEIHQQPKLSEQSSGLVIGKSLPNASPVSERKNSYFADDDTADSDVSVVFEKGSQKSLLSRQSSQWTSRDFTVEKEKQGCLRGDSVYDSSTEQETMNTSGTPIKPHMVPDDDDDDDATQPLSPMESFTIESSETIQETKSVEMEMDTKSQSAQLGTKRKLEEADSGEPVVKRRPIIFDFEWDILKENDASQVTPPPPSPPAKTLVNKSRIQRKLFDKKPVMFAPPGINPKEYTKTIIHHFSTYRILLRDAQSRQPVGLGWGNPVVVGKHYAHTIDRKGKDQEMYDFSLDDGDDDVHFGQVPAHARLNPRTLRLLNRHRLLETQIAASQPEQKQKLKLYPSGRKPQQETENRQEKTKSCSPRIKRPNLFSVDDESSGDEFEALPRRKKRQSTPSKPSAEVVPETQDMFGDQEETQDTGFHITEIPESPLRKDADTYQSKVDEPDVTVIDESQLPNTPVKVSRVNEEENSPVLARPGRGHTLKQNNGNPVSGIPNCLLHDANNGDTSGSNFDDLFSDSKNHKPKSIAPKLNGSENSDSCELDDLLIRKVRTQDNPKSNKSRQFAKNVPEGELASDEVKQSAHDHTARSEVQDKRKRDAEVVYHKVDGAGDGIDPVAGPSTLSGTRRGGRRRKQRLGNNEEQPLNDGEQHRCKKQKVEEPEIDCPICYQKFGPSEIVAHASECKGEEAARENQPRDAGKRLHGGVNVSDSSRARVISHHDEIGHPQRPLRQYGQRKFQENHLVESRDSPAVSSENDSQDEWLPGKEDIRDERADEADSLADTESEDPLLEDASKTKKWRVRQKKEVPGANASKRDKAQATSHQRKVSQADPKTQTQQSKEKQQTASSDMREQCFMCSQYITTSQYEQHVTECVDKAEIAQALGSGATRGAVPVCGTVRQSVEGAEVPELISRPTRRRPLRPAAGINRLVEIDDDENPPTNVRQRRI